MSMNGRFKTFAGLSAVALVAITLTGCPPTYSVVPGDWVLAFSTIPLGITYGLTLHEDGGATPYESTPSEGAMRGAWAWKSNGVQMTFYQFTGGKQFVYEGELYADSAAAGSWREADSQLVLGNWDAVLEP